MYMDYSLQQQCVFLGVETRNRVALMLRLRAGYLAGRTSDLEVTSGYSYRCVLRDKLGSSRGTEVLPLGRAA
jgi:hypothetical protein